MATNTARPDKNTVLSNEGITYIGMFMLFSRACYEAIGGHERVRTDVNEDIRNRVNDAVNAIAVAGNGDGYVGGQFTTAYSAGGVSQTKAARLAPAASDSVPRRRSRPPLNQSTPASTAVRRFGCSSAETRSSERKCRRALAVGRTVMATTIDARIDAETAIAAARTMADLEGSTGASILNRVAYDMAERGLLFRVKKDDQRKYAAIPFVHGIFEFQVGDMSRDLAEKIQLYFDEVFHQAMRQNGDLFLRTIPVNRSIDADLRVASYDDAVEILKGLGKIVVTNCVCRVRAGRMEEDCGKPLEVCFLFGSMGQYYVDRGMGRQISVDEAVSILETCHESGLVTQPASSQNPGGMCNCCGDCCGVLISLKKHPKPASMVLTNYYAEVDPERCTACETCMDRCQMDAVAMQDDIAQIDLDRCICCGLCVTTCPSEALRLVKKSDDQLYEPPASGMETYIRIAQERGKM